MTAVPSPFAPLDLVIPFAACSGEAWAQAMKTLPADSLKNLDKLLAGMTLADEDKGSAHSLSPPHERVAARAAGLANGGVLKDGLIPWAALEASKTLGDGGKAWAFVTPCHWAMGREHATLTDPAALALSEAGSRTLLGAMQPYFETEGITLHYAAPARWLAEGELLRDLPTASLDRVLGRNVDAWLPGTSRADGRSAGPPQARPDPSGGSALHEVKSVGATLRRLQNEMQMLLYTHAINDERASQRQLPVNSFWLSGTGALAQPLTGTSSVNTPRSLAQAAFTDDWPAYAEAWKALDVGDIAALLARQRAGDTVRLALCGESSARTWQSAPTSLFSRFTSLFRSECALDGLKQL